MRYQLTAQLVAVDDTDGTHLRRLSGGATVPYTEDAGGVHVGTLVPITVSGVANAVLVQTSAVVPARSPLARTRWAKTVLPLSRTLHRIGAIEVTRGERVRVEVSIGSQVTAAVARQLPAPIGELADARRMTPAQGSEADAA